MGRIQAPHTQLGCTANIFYIFGPVKKSVKGYTFVLDEDVWYAVVGWFRQQLKEFFADWVHWLLHQ
jgi:hypothetical protein